jgi:hypothetical protein
VPGNPLRVDGTALTRLLAEAIAQAGRHGGGVRIEELENGWETSIAVGGRRVAIARDKYLEAAIRRLNDHAQVRDL